MDFGCAGARRRTRMIQWILHAFWIEVAGVLYNRRIREEKLDVPSHLSITVFGDI